MTEKKSERLEVRLGFQEKSEFVEACETQGDTPSSALRRFIRGYVRRADADMFASAWRGLGKQKYILPACIAALGLIVFGGWSVLKPAPNLIEKTDMEALTQALEPPRTNPEKSDRLTGQAAFDAAKAAGPRPEPEIDFGTFERLDKNKDGILTRGEILPSDHHIHRLLDIDSEDGIAPQEFYPRGNMQYKIAESWDMKTVGASQQLAHKGPDDTINVQFDLAQSPPFILASRPLEDAVIARPDRTVIWEKDAKKPFLVFSNDTHRVRKANP